MSIKLMEVGMEMPYSSVPEMVLIDKADKLIGLRVVYFKGHVRNAAQRNGWRGTITSSELMENAPSRHLALRITVTFDNGVVQDYHYGTLGNVSIGGKECKHSSHYEPAIWVTSLAVEGIKYRMNSSVKDTPVVNNNVTYNVVVDEAMLTHIGQKVRQRYSVELPPGECFRILAKAEAKPEEDYVIIGSGFEVFGRAGTPEEADKLLDEIMSDHLGETFWIYKAIAKAKTSKPKVEKWVV